MTLGIHNNTFIVTCLIFVLFSSIAMVLSGQEGYDCPKRRKISEFGRAVGLLGSVVPDKNWLEEHKPKDISQAEEKSHGCIRAFLRGYNTGLRESGLDKLMQYFLYEKKEEMAKNHGYIPQEDVLQNI